MSDMQAGTGKTEIPERWQSEYDELSLMNNFQFPKRRRQLIEEIGAAESQLRTARGERDAAMEAIDDLAEQVAQLQTTISQLREHIANLLGLKQQAPLENITDYTVFGESTREKTNDAG
jgi:predicted  nucleic acid-binding Zn-ribbon protein